jgi:hypothetical protein
MVLRADGARALLPDPTRRGLGPAAPAHTRDGETKARLAGPLGKWQALGLRHLFLTPDYDIISSTTKANLVGFTEVQDSEQTFLCQFDELRAEKIIP